MTSPGTVDAADDGRDAFHIVCHDCQTEFLTSRQAEAEQRLSEHRTSTGHNVEFASLGASKVENE